MRQCFACGTSCELSTCARCRDYMHRGILLIQVADGETSQTPRRLGGLALVLDAILRPALSPEAYEAARRRRATYIPATAWRALGLPVATTTPLEPTGPPTAGNSGHVVAVSAPGVVYTADDERSHST